MMILARRIPALPLLLLCLWLGGCRSVPTAEESAGRIQRALRVIQSPQSSARSIAHARQDYRHALSDVLPGLAEGADNPFFSRQEKAAPGFYRFRDFAQLSPVRRSRVTFPGLYRAGIGLPAVGWISPGGYNAPSAGYHVAVTALALPKESGVFEVRLANPERVPSFGEFSVAMDLQAALDQIRATGPRFGTGLGYLLRAYRFREPGRLTFLQPYDPKKIPVVLVHGLMSTPRMWRPVVEELLSDRTIRERYQFWFFYYPTGQPLPLSALELREALDAAVARHRVRQPLILVGHSMGGILARAQVSRITLRDAEAILPGIANLPADSLVRHALVFEPRTDVSRVVFIATPHRGSGFAAGRLAEWASGLIRLPSMVASELTPIADFLMGEHGGRLPTSIHGLSPSSRFLAALNRTAPTVPVHSIIGSSDGVVPFSSSHLEGAESELVVPAGHGGFAHPLTIRELKRILDEEAAPRFF